MMSLPRSSNRLHSWLLHSNLIGPLCVATLAMVWILCGLDAGGEWPAAGPGPGLTSDEPFNARSGVVLADAFLSADLAAYRMASGQLPDHPPLGRLWLGLWHELTFPLFAGPLNDRAYSLVCIRIGSAVAFAVCIFISGFTAGRWYGQPAGTLTAAFVLLSPRLFGHAHLAALETVTMCGYVSFVLYTASAWGTATGSRSIDEKTANKNTRNDITRQHDTVSWRAAVVSGLLLGAAAAIKIQAVLLPIPFVIWALFSWRLRGIVPVLITGGVAAAVFFGAWPWLWEEPILHTQMYLGRTTNRAVIWVHYLGRQWADNQVPWHFPWVMFVASQPAWLNLLAVCGVTNLLVETRRRLATETSPPTFTSHSRSDWLLLLTTLFPCVVFSVPGVAVYDGERLFNMTIPLWSLLAGRGVAAVWIRSMAIRWVVTTGMLVTAATMFTWPHACLSYYPLSLGGLATADRVGLQRCYWTESLSRDVLEHVAAAVPNGSSLDVAPVVDGLYLQELLSQSPVLQRRQISLRAYNPDSITPAEWVLVVFRREYIPERDWPGWQTATAVVERRVQGIRMVALFQRPEFARDHSKL